MIEVGDSGAARPAGRVDRADPRQREAVADAAGERDVWEMIEAWTYSVARVPRRLAQSAMPRASSDRRLHGYDDAESTPSAPECSARRRGSVADGTGAERLPGSYAGNGVVPYDRPAYGEEEWVLGLSGTATLRTPEGEGSSRRSSWPRSRRAGGRARRRCADGEAPARAPDVGDIVRQSATAYPDGDEIAVWRDQAVDLIAGRSSADDYSTAMSARGPAAAAGPADRGVMKATAIERRGGAGATRGVVRCARRARRPRSPRDRRASRRSGALDLEREHAEAEAGSSRTRDRRHPRPGQSTIRQHQQRRPRRRRPPGHDGRCLWRAALAELADQSASSGRAASRTSVRVQGSQSSSGRSAPASASEPDRSAAARHRHAAEALDRRPVGALDRVGLVRPRRHHHAGHGQPGGARRLDREQRVVDRAEPGACGDHQRQPELDREVADEVARRERDEQAADALADQHVGVAGRARACASELARLDRLAGQLGRAGGARPAGRTVSGATSAGRLARVAAAASSSWSRGHSPAGSSSPVTTGLNAATRSPARGQRRADRRGDDGLADTGVGAGDEEAAQRPARRLRRGRRRRAERSAARRRGAPAGLRATGQRDLRAA